MTTTLVRADTGDTTRSVSKTLARALDATVQPLAPEAVLGEPSTTGWTDAVLQALQAPSALLAVVRRAHGPDAAPMWDLLQRTAKPVLVVPERLDHRHHAIRRCLVPIDGSPESVAAVLRTLDLFARSGIAVTVLHLFDLATTPPFWDHAGHADRVWRQEFQRRLGRLSPLPVSVSGGVPGERILTAAAREHADLIVLCWSQQHDPERARTVRDTLADTRVPLLLVPTVGTLDPHAAVPHEV